MIMAAGWSTVALLAIGAIALVALGGFIVFMWFAVQIIDAITNWK